MGGAPPLETLRILVVDDFEPYRRFVTLKNGLDVQLIDEAADGLGAVNKAEEFKPDLILLDIGLPKLNGIEAAQGIRTFSLESKIIFVSQESSADLVEQALSMGAQGYVVKHNSGRELLTAVNAVLRGETQQQHVRLLKNCYNP